MEEQEEQASAVNMKNVMSNRDPSSYPKNIRDNIVLMSIDKQRAIPMGTLSYSYALYPSDIDVFEVFGKKWNQKETADKFAKSIQKLVKRLLDHGNYWILEVKCGKDTRFEIELDDPSFARRMKSIRKRGWFSNDELEILDSGNPDAIREMLRNKMNIRWNTDEILRGTKQLIGDVTVTLPEAVLTGSQINIECITLVNGKFTDISNFFVLMYIDRKGKEHAINLPDLAVTDFPTFFDQNLKSAIYKMMYDTAKQDFYKATKRLWSYAKFKRNEEIIKKLMPFVNSIVALVGQKRSEIKTLINLAKHTKLANIPNDLFVNQVSNLKLPLSSAIQLGMDTINKINKILDSVKVDTPYKDVIRKLTKVYDILNEFVQANSFRFLKQAGFYPLPNYLQ